MINREWQSVQLLSYSETSDEYGQKKTSSTSISIDMVCKIYGQNNTNNMRYAEVELVGITKYSAITDKNIIKVNDVEYRVLYVIPSGKYYQILMKKND